MQDGDFQFNADAGSFLQKVSWNKKYLLAIFFCEAHVFLGILKRLSPSKCIT